MTHRPFGSQHAVVDSNEQAQLALTLLRHAPQAVVVIDPDHRIVLFNPAAEAIFGYAQAEIQDQPLDWLLPPEAVRPHWGHSRPFSGSGEPRRWPGQQTRTQGKKRDGSVFPVHMAIVQGELRGTSLLLAIVTDLTEREEAEAAKADSEAFFRAVFQHAALGIALVAPDHRPVEANPALARMLGREPADLLGMRFEDFTHPEDRDADAALFDELVKGVRDRYSIEKRFLTLEKEEMWGQLNVSLMPPDRDGNRYALALVEDITDRKLAEETLRDQERSLEEILDQLPLMLFLKEADTLRFERFNAAGETLTGRSRHELLGRTDYDFFPADQAGFFAEKDREVIESERVHDIAEEPIQTPHGERLLHTRKTVITDGHGRPRHLLGVSQDITERVREQKELERERNLAQALSDVMALLMEPVQDLAALYEAICQIAVERGGVVLAWIGEVDEAGSLIPQAAYGAGKDYLDRIEVSSDPARPEGQGPSGRAFREGRRVVSQNFIQDAQAGPWHKPASEHGFQASAALPLFRAGQAIGTLNVYADQPGFFSEPLLELIGQLTTALSAALDRFDREAERRALQVERDRMAEALDQSGDLVWIADPQGLVVYANPALAASLNTRPSDMVSTHITAWLKPGMAGGGLAASLNQVCATGETRREVFSIREGDGESHYLDETLSPILGQEGDIRFLVGTGRDVTERLNMQRQLHDLAYYDPLTGLPNRGHFLERLQHAFERARRRGELLAILFIDLDGFKDINDSLGHDTGDRVLQAFSRRIQQTLRGEDTLARQGGDEWVLLVERLQEPEIAAKVAERILGSLREPVVVDGVDFRLRTSIGIALFPTDSENPEELLGHADAAMYRAKGEGGHRYQFAEPAITAEASERLFISRELRRALDQDALSVYYQPIVDLPEGSVVGLEALVRWYHPERGWISPGRFVPEAENTGLIGELDQWVVDSVLCQARDWKRAGLQVPRISVNVSVTELKEPGYADDLARRIAAVGLRPSSLELEVTEGVFLEAASAPEAALRELRGLGASVAIDDFGTGYSSLTYISRLPADRLKVDQAFVRDAHVSQENQTLLSAMAALAKGFGLTLLGEGVEAGKEADYLAGLGFQEAQGFHYAKPMPAEDVAALLARGNA